MRVVLSTWGRFHVFHLARQMERFGWLSGVFVTYPRVLLRRERIAPEKLFCNPWLHTPLLMKWRAGFHNTRLDQAWLRLMDDDQNKYIARHMPACDVFIALSGSGLRGGRVVQERGGKWLCNRSSSHLAFQQELLAEEHARHGADFYAPNPWAVEKELREYEESDLIVVPSDYAKRTFIEKGVDAGKVVKIGFGGDLDTFYRVGEPKPDEFMMLYCGQVSFRKGIPYLLEAFHRLRHPKKRLVVAGTVMPEIKDYLTRVNLDGVEFAGVADRARLRALYSEARAFAIASLDEGMANVQTEAMSCGTPVVATDHAGGTDIIRDGVDGYIVPIRSPEIMAERLQRIADDPKRGREMGANAHARIKSLGGWDSFGDRYRDVLLSVRQ